MKRLILPCFALLLATPFFFASPAMAEPPAGDGWKPLFNGEDLDGWKLPDGAGDIWTVVDRTIDCNPKQGRKGDQSLWSAGEYGDFTLHCEWRIKETKGEGYPVPTVLPDGTDQKDADGKTITTKMPNADSGIYLRGTPNAQVNIWCWPIGSGEVYGYRMSESATPEVRAGVTPKMNADNPVGEWNTFVITMKGDRLTVELNGKKVIENAQLPGVPAKGPIALQHHGGYDAAKDEWNSASSLVQFRNIYIKEE
ncbi:MAG: hypothetical protein AMXMBFR84_36620 [Candidatus Hydrogenedentota bacterium]